MADNGYIVEVQYTGRTVKGVINHGEIVRIVAPYHGIGPGYLVCTADGREFAVLAQHVREV